MAKKRLSFKSFSEKLFMEIKKYEKRSIKCVFSFEQDRRVRYKTNFTFTHYSGKYPKGLYEISIPMKCKYEEQMNFLEMLKRVRLGKNILTDFNEFYITEKERKVYKKHQMSLSDFINTDKEV